jgi:hypothetical protein
MSDYHARKTNMSHLPTERLAALVDESPTSAELAHLAGCAECARERAMFCSLAELATAESARIGAPLTSWESLAPVLKADGVIDNGRGLLFRSRNVRRPWLQAAAAVLLIAGGMMAGRYTAGLSPLPLSEAERVAQAPAPKPDSAPSFQTIDDARTAQAQAQVMYQMATAFLAAQDTAGHAVDSPSAMRTRLAALDRARDVMGEALNDAPYDPVINGYYLTTLGQREATLRQLNIAMPASARMMSY